MKYKLLYVLFCVAIILLSFGLGEYYNHYKSQKWLDENSISKSDIQKLSDGEYLQGIKDGGHCVSISEVQSKKDQRCIDAMNRIMGM